jgi:hypothetical protein
MLSDENSLDLLECVPDNIALTYDAPMFQNLPNYKARLMMTRKWSKKASNITGNGTNNRLNIGLFELHGRE